MNFSRVVYLIGQGPRILGLVKELWRVLVESSDQRVLEYISDIESVTKKLREAKGHEERSKLAADISLLIRRL